MLSELHNLWSIERVVVLLTPIFTGISAWLVAWIGVHFPGHPKLDSGEVTALMIAGGAFAVSVVLKWLHGRQVPPLMQIPARIATHPGGLQGSPGVGPAGAPATPVTP